MMITKKVFFYLSIGILFFASCSQNSKSVNNKIIHEGNISTHTRTSHIVYQNITSEELELAKEYIHTETAPGVSRTYIEEEGAKLINEHRNK